MRGIFGVEKIVCKIGESDVRSTLGFFKIKESLFGRRMTDMINSAVILGAVLATVFVIYSSIKYITAGGDENKAKEAKNGIKYAATGLVILLVSYAIISAVRTIFDL